MDTSPTSFSLLLEGGLEFIHRVAFIPYTVTLAFSCPFAGLFSPSGRLLFRSAHSARGGRLRSAPGKLFLSSILLSDLFPAAASRKTPNSHHVLRGRRSPTSQNPAGVPPQLS